MAIITEQNSITDILKYQPMRCDTHFKHNIILASDFFSNPDIDWVSLGSILNNVRNGMNVNTEYYSMEETDYHYLSVSQIKEYGLSNKNQNFLTEYVTELPSYFELEKNTLLITRSGTIGVAISTDHASFNMDNKHYIASGFVITAELKNNISSATIANYINMFPVQRYLIAMSAGACQKNISQPVIANLPIPSILLKPGNHCENIFSEYEETSKKILDAIAINEVKLENLKEATSKKIINQLVKEYS
ncbi:MAG: hypothetical protein HFG89_08630 [Dorea sp.]|jgi:hypothetical protein|nr:hypothetical protein [Dorea sp.]